MKQSMRIKHQFNGYLSSLGHHKNTIKYLYSTKMHFNSFTEVDRRVTKNFVKKVHDFLEVLSEFPEIGTIENKEKGIRGFTILKQINIFYRIKGDTIILLDFFDNRKNPSKRRF